MCMDVCTRACMCGCAGALVRLVGVGSFLASFVEHTTCTYPSGGGAFSDFAAAAAAPLESIRYRVVCLMFRGVPTAVWFCCFWRTLHKDPDLRDTSTDLVHDVTLEPCKKKTQKSLQLGNTNILSFTSTITHFAHSPFCPMCTSQAGFQHLSRTKSCAKNGVLLFQLHCSFVSVHRS